MAELIDALRGLSNDERKAFVARQHPHAVEWAERWQLLIDAYDEVGGFSNGGYLWQFPRESEGQFTRRKQQARYHNYIESLVGIFVRHVFKAGVTRSSQDERLTTWWGSVDRDRRDMTAFMRQALGRAVAAAHTWIVMDRPAAVPAGPTRADERGLDPFLARYAPTSVTNWLTDEHGIMTGLVIVVAAPQSVAQFVDGKDAGKRYLVWDATSWMVVDADGAIVDAPERPEHGHNLGAVPVTVLAPAQAESYPIIGRPVVSPTLVKALYNRASEEDLVIRDQAFSLLTVEVDKDTDVNEVRTEIGADVGTTTAMVLRGKAEWKTPDQSVPKTIRDNQVYLVREIWRMAHVRFESDSREGMTAEAIREQNEELNQVLVDMAQTCTNAELQIARWFFRWMTPGDLAAAEAAFDAAQVSVTYPREFFAGELLTDLEAWAQAIAIDLGPTATGRIKKRVIGRLDPDLDDKTRQTIEDEIDAQAEQARAKATQPQADGTTTDLEADALRASAASRLRRYVDAQQPADGGAQA